MAANKQSANSSSKGQFRPKALEPPRIGVSDVDYNVYVANYRFYIESLAALRNEFWSDVAKPEVRTFVKRNVWHFRTKEGFEGYSPTAIESSEKRSVMPTEALDVVRSEKTSMVKTPVPVKEPTPEQLKARKDIKKAARRRQRQNRRMRDARQAVTFSSNLVQVAKNNETLAKSRYTFGTTGVSPHSVVLPGRKKKKSGTDPAGKGKGSGGGPPPPRPQGPPGGAPPDSKDDKGPSDDPGKGRKPNRKERRRARFGPPGSSQEEKGKSVPSEQEDYVAPVAGSFDADWFAKLEARTSADLTPLGRSVKTQMVGMSLESLGRKVDAVNSSDPSRAPRMATVGSVAKTIVPRKLKDQK